MANENPVPEETSQANGVDKAKSDKISDME